jgi:mannitol/fructose-specific phosphotransferase system IIA component (Ntr-type)
VQLSGSNGIDEAALADIDYLRAMTTGDTISSFLSLDSVAVGMPGGEAKAVIDRMVDLLKSDERVRDLERLREAVNARERMMSTGVGTGLAIPHTRTDAVSSTVGAFAVTAEPALFGSPDEVPVRLVFLLAGPASDMSRHIRVLSRISRLMQREEFRLRLLSAATPLEVLEAFEGAESTLLAS